MRSSLVSAALLCFTTWMSMVHATHGPAARCCNQWSTTRVRHDRILNYTIQSEGICPINAVIFKTPRKIICSDPNDDWTQRTMQKVDGERIKKASQGKRQNEDRSTPAASTTSKKTPRERGRNGRRRQRTKSWRGKKGQRKRA